MLSTLAVLALTLTQLDSEAPQLSEAPPKPEQPAPRPPRELSLGFHFGGARSSTLYDLKNNELENISAVGTYASLEGAMVVRSWFEVRGVLSGIWTHPTASHCKGVSPCDVSAKIGVLTPALRFMTPYELVGVFGEVGLGLGAGHAHNELANAVSRNYRGVDPAFLVGLGMFVGPKRLIEVGVRSYGLLDFHSFLGMFYIGANIPLAGF